MFLERKTQREENTDRVDYELTYYVNDVNTKNTQVLMEYGKRDELKSVYTYDPFGNVITGASDFDSFYGYNAEDTNPVTGLQYLRARCYDSEDGRFSVADTYLGDVSELLTLNRYSYTVNNPIMQTDPSGHWSDWLDNAASAVKKGVRKAANWVDEIKCIFQ